MMRKDELEKRKRRNFPHYVAVQVLDDRKAWAGRVIEMETWARTHVGPYGFAKQGRMGNERPSLEFRFKSHETAAEFQAAFGGKVGAERTETPARKKAPQLSAQGVLETDQGRP